MDSSENKLYKQTLTIGHLEGISFIILLGIAMPLKYLYEIPKAVTIAGMIHGALFIAFLYFVYQLFDAKKWTLKQCFGAFLLSIIPFGTFFLKKI